MQRVRALDSGNLPSAILTSYFLIVVIQALAASELFLGRGESLRGTVCDHPESPTLFRRAVAPTPSARPPNTPSLTHISLN